MESKATDRFSELPQRLQVVVLRHVAPEDAAAFSRASKDSRALAEQFFRENVASFPSCCEALKNAAALTLVLRFSTRLQSLESLPAPSSPFAERFPRFAAQFKLDEAVAADPVCYLLTRNAATLQRLPRWQLSVEALRLARHCPCLQE